MKKIILTIAVVMAATFANAQDKKESVTTKEIVFGVKGGLNNSNYTGDADSDAATSFYIGGLVDFHITEKFHVQPELLYSVEGAKDDSMTFLRVPIMAKFYVGDGFSLQAGPELAFKIAAEDDLTDEFSKSLDYGLGFGAGYELSSGLMFDARYNLGLANISDVDGFDVGTSSIQVGLGYRF